MSSEGFRSPPRAVHTSADDRSSGGGNATASGTGSFSAANCPVSSAGGSVSCRRNVISSADRIRCSSSARWAQAVSRYDSLMWRGGGGRATTRPRSYSLSSPRLRLRRSSRRSYRYRFTVGAVRRAAHSLVGASKTTSTSDPRSASSLTNRRSASSTS